MADYTIDMKAHMNKVLVASLEGGSAKEDVANSLERIAAHCGNIGLTLSATYAKRSAQQVREAPSLFEDVSIRAKQPKHKARSLSE